MRAESSKPRLSRPGLRPLSPALRSRTPGAHPEPAGAGAGGAASPRPELCTGSLPTPGAARSAFPRRQPAPRRYSQCVYYVFTRGGLFGSNNLTRALHRFGKRQRRDRMGGACADRLRRRDVDRAEGGRPCPRASPPAATPPSQQRTHRGDSYAPQPRLPTQPRPPRTHPRTHTRVLSETVSASSAHAQNTIPLRVVSDKPPTHTRTRSLSTSRAGFPRGRRPWN